MMKQDKMLQQVYCSKCGNLQYNEHGPLSGMRDAGESRFADLMEELWG
ncbi:MAG: hypothetical protein HC888_16680 [Candidatus Competibacteraceae bacterium]|nr:hypothetical protein [Candidatus Competibacteraceae bacterium]